VDATLPPGGKSRRAKSRLLVFTSAALTLAAAAIAVLLVVRLGSGQLIVTVSGPDNEVVDDAKVLIDGEQKCGRVPCRLHDLSAGVHLVRVEAPGYRASADRAVEVRHGAQAVIEVLLSRERQSGGLRVPAVGAGLRLVVDGLERGSLPVEVADLEAGEHVVQLVGNDQYEKYEQRVAIEAGRVVTLAPKLRIVKARARVELAPGAAGAHVRLQCGTGDPVTLHLPTTVTVETKRRCQIIAAKPGFEPYVRRLAFGDGEIEKTFIVELDPAEELEPALPGQRAAATAGRKASTAAAGPAGQININSIPSARVLLDGRPVGKTPTRVSASPGKHTVIFIHPQRGRRTVRVQVRSGKAATAAVRFNAS
jgi:hypothetical protein